MWEELKWYRIRTSQTAWRPLQGKREGQELERESQRSPPFKETGTDSDVLTKSKRNFLLLWVRELHSSWCFRKNSCRHIPLQSVNIITSVRCRVSSPVNRKRQTPGSSYICRIAKEMSWKSDDQDYRHRCCCTCSRQHIHRSSDWTVVCVLGWAWTSETSRPIL